MEGQLILIAHNIRSAHNVGAFFRTADGAGVSKIILSGYTQAPPEKGKLVLSAGEKSLKKTALGAEEMVPWEKYDSLQEAISHLRQEGFSLVALEQSEGSLDYRDWQPSGKTALLLGNEVGGVEEDALQECDAILEIPMRGDKDSLNVSVAAGIALYQITGRIERGT